ncbi:S1 family peptidase [Corynebacterium aquilae]|uniref:Peptidase S1 domain-containing protein n=1 Tax=Corynebacterium aquilae DSM 44791 TaxID=1431546 RepID=A0A1L7CF56_9CORY|nr:trypsin-like serine protease [Corynebacterium aquilae]APT84465.1 hypothetical protein CAQU_04650 [Corynebacterium aquilae DSM 44791]
MAHRTRSTTLAGLMGAGMLAISALSAAPPADALILAGPVTAGVAQSAVASLKLGNASCTGTLIAPEWILTARHCVGEGAGNAISVGAGIGGHARRATDVIMSPYADLALVRLDAPVDARPAVLGRGHLQPGQQGTIAGWGSSLLVAKQTPGTVGHRFLAGENMISPPGSAYLDVATHGGRLTKGDSGGPLLMGDEVVAVASMANTAAPLPVAGTRAFYVPVAEHLEWISRHTGIVVAPAFGVPQPPVSPDVAAANTSSFGSS